jgi:hypothetical protein
MATAIAPILFSGEPEILGGLSNEEVLVEKCPAEFHLDNPWSNYASKFFFLGANISNGALRKVVI